MPLDVWTALALGDSGLYERVPSIAPQSAVRRESYRARWCSVYKIIESSVSVNPGLTPRAVVRILEDMPKFVIEREIPGAGKLSADELHAISQKSCGVLRQMGPQIQWVESYVTDDKVYCVYIAPDEASVREHATRGGFPANRVSQVRSRIDPTTSE